MGHPHALPALHMAGNTWPSCSKVLIRFRNCLLLDYSCNFFVFQQRGPQLEELKIKKLPYDIITCNLISHSRREIKCYWACSVFKRLRVT